MYCHLCATRIDEGDYFCRNCGEASKVPYTANGETGWPSAIGYFLLGSALFAVFIFALLFLISSVFPLLPSPQLTILILFVLNTVFAGLCLSIFVNARRKETVTKLKSEPQATQLTGFTAHQLPEGKFFEAPESVVVPTTRELIKR